MKLVAKSGAFRYLLDQRIGLLQPFRRQIHFQTHQKLIWALMIVALEKPAEISRIQMAFASQLLKRPNAPEIPFNMFATMLVAEQG